MGKYVYWAVVVALAGFLFGFDTIVISGADQQLQALWGTSDVFHGFVVMAAALWGTVIGAIFGGIPTLKLGRKDTLIAIGVLFFISALGSALVSDPYVFALFRFIGGLGVGASTIAAPAYISEVSPAHSRGRLVALYQLSIVVGILGAFLSNYLLRGMGEDSWRWMLGVEAVPALAYSLGILGVPRSPRWLALKGRLEEARKVLAAIDPQAKVEELVEAVTPKKGLDSILAKAYRGPFLLAFFIALFNQLSGINAFLYYSPRIFGAAGLGEESAFLSSVGVGGVNVLFTVVGMALVDRLGRKQLMYMGSVGYILSLGAGAVCFFLEVSGLAVPIFLFVFIASHAIGQGTVIWVFIAEIFPTHLRASGQAFGSSVHWVLAAFIPSMIPMLFSNIGPGMVFAFFAVMMVGQMVWVHFYMPETKGKSLEDLGSTL